MVLFGYQFERRLLLLAPLLIALGAGAVWLLRAHSGAQPEASSPSQAESFSHDLKPWSATTAVERKGLYWLGPTLPGAAPYLRRVEGQIERGVVFYTDPGHPDQVYVIVRTLDTAPLPGGAPSAGATLLARLKKSPRLAVPHGQAGLLTTTQAAIAPGKGTVIELTVFNPPPGQQLDVKTLVGQLQPA